jgi:hypothetical protein
MLRTKSKGDSKVNTCTGGTVGWGPYFDIFQQVFVQPLQKGNKNVTVFQLDGGPSDR